MGTGLNGAEREALRETLAPAERAWDEKSRPNHLCGWVPARPEDVPDVWYEPQGSAVMEAIAEINCTAMRTPSDADARSVAAPRRAGGADVFRAHAGEGV